MSLRDNIRKIIENGHCNAIQAEQLTLANYAGSTFLRAKQVDKELLPPTVIGFLSRWLKLGKQPDYAALRRELEALVASGREAAEIVAERRSQLAATGAAFTRAELLDLGFLEAAANCCEALRAYCYSMETGDFASERNAYVASYRHWFTSGMELTVRKLNE